MKFIDIETQTTGNTGTGNRNGNVIIDIDSIEDFSSLDQQGNTGTRMVHFTDVDVVDEEYTVTHSKQDMFVEQDREQEERKAKIAKRMTRYFSFVMEEDDEEQEIQRMRKRKTQSQNLNLQTAAVHSVAVDLSSDLKHDEESQQVVMATQDLNQEGISKSNLYQEGEQGISLSNLYQGILNKLKEKEDKNEEELLIYQPSSNAQFLNNNNAIDITWDNDV